MKLKTIFLSLLFISTISAFAQDMESLKKEAKKAYKAGVTMNFEMIFETTYPKVFEIIPKEAMKGMFKQMMDNEQLSITLVEVEPNFSFGEIKKIGDKTFCVVDHDNVMSLKFKTPIEDAESMASSFKSSMNAKKVLYDKDSGTFTIELRSTLIAVADESTKNIWKFLNKDKENKLFKMIFDQETKVALGL